MIAGVAAGALAGPAAAHTYYEKLFIEVAVWYGRVGADYYLCDRDMPKIMRENAIKVAARYPKPMLGEITGGVLDETLSDRIEKSRGLKCDTEQLRLDSDAFTEKLKFMFEVSKKLKDWDSE
jgi:hypothetical protein